MKTEKSEMFIFWFEVLVKSSKAPMHVNKVVLPNVFLS